MTKDERKYKFDSKVKVPDINDISKMAADFSDPVMPKSKMGVSESLTKNAKVAKLDSTITAMQKEMNKLAREVVKEETTKPEVEEKTQPETEVKAEENVKNDSKQAAKEVINDEAKDSEQKHIEESEELLDNASEVDKIVNSESAGTKTSSSKSKKKNTKKPQNKE